MQGPEDLPPQLGDTPVGLGVGRRGPLVHRPLPLLHRLRRHVAHLGTRGAELGRRPVAEEDRLPQHHRRHRPRPRRAGVLDELRQQGHVDPIEQIADPEEPGPAGGKLVVGHEGLDGVVEVVDRGLPRREDVPQPDGVGHVARERQADLVGGRRHRVEDVGREVLVDLHEVVAALVVLAHELPALLGGGDARPAHRRAADEEPRTQGLAAGDAGPQTQLRPLALHAPDGGDAVGDVEEEQVAGVGLHRARPRQVPVHLGQPRHEVHALGLDRLGALGDLHLVRRMHRRDAAAGHHDRPVLHDHGHAGLGHRDDVHPDEREVSPHLRQRIAATGEHREDGEGEPGGGDPPVGGRSHLHDLVGTGNRLRARSHATTLEGSRRQAAGAAGRKRFGACPRL